MDTDDSVVVVRGKGVGDWMEVGKGMDGDICNSVNNKYKGEKWENHLCLRNVPLMYFCDKYALLLITQVMEKS